MRIKDVIPAEKSNIDWGEWKSQKTPKTWFPVSRSRNSLVLRKPWRQRLITFDALGESFRIFLAMREEKESCRAILGQEIEQEMRALVRLEFHATHPGWHVHAACGKVDEVPVGRLNGPWFRRIPKARTYHKRDGYGITEESATDYIAKWFRLYNSSDDTGRLF